MALGIGEKTCIYCLDKGVEFAEDHVISRTLGGSNRYQLKCVCRKCNNERLSSLENIVKSDSPQGFFASVHKLGRSGNYKPLSQRMKVDQSFDGDSPIDIDAILPIVGEGGKANVRKQIILRNDKGKVYNVVEERDFKAKSILEKMKSLGGNSVEMVSYGFSEEELKAIDSDVQAAGKAVSERETKILDSGTVIPKKIVSIQQLVDRDIKRAVAKCAFNYFVFCAQDGYATLLYDKGFDYIRNYILQPDDEYKGGELVTTEVTAITFDGKVVKPGSNCHLIKFWSEQQHFGKEQGFDVEQDRHVIVVEVNFFSLMSFRVNLAYDPFAENKIILGTMGCGHFIDLDKDQWIRIDKDNMPSGEGFGVFGTASLGKEKKS